MARVESPNAGFTIRVLSGTPAPVWSGTPAPDFPAFTAAPYPITTFVQAYNAATDVITLQSGTLPPWCTFNGTAFAANGTQSDASDFGPLVLRVTRAGQSTNSSQFNVTVAAGALWLATPAPSFVAGSTSPYPFSSFITGYNASTDAITLGAGSVALPSWLQLSGATLVPNGTQTETSDFSGLILRVIRNATPIGDSASISVSVVGASIGPYYAYFEPHRISGPPGGWNAGAQRASAKQNCHVQVPGGRWWKITGDHVQIDESPGVPAGQGGRNEIFSFELAGSTRGPNGWRMEQPYYLYQADGHSVQYSNPDDASAAICGNYIWGLTSGRVGEPAFPAGVATQDFLNVCRLNLTDIAADGRARWSVVGPRPAETVGSGTLQGMIGDPVRNKVWAPTTYSLIHWDATSGVETTQRYPGNNQAWQIISAPGGSPGGRWQVCGPVIVGEFMYLMDWINRKLVRVNLTTYLAWPGLAAPMPSGMTTVLEPAIPNSWTGWNGSSRQMLVYLPDLDAIAFFGENMNYNTRNTRWYSLWITPRTANPLQWQEVTRNDIMAQGDPTYAYLASAKQYYDPTKNKILAIVHQDGTAPEPHVSAIPDNYWSITVTDQMPSWRPGQGQVKVIAGNAANPSKIKDNDPCPSRSCSYNGPRNLGFTSITNAWGSGAYSPHKGKYGTYLVCSGGDGDYWGNDVHAVQFGDGLPTWQRLNNPFNEIDTTGPDAGGITGSPTTDPNYDPTNGEWGINARTNANAVRSACMPHVYDNLVFLPPHLSGNAHGSLLFPITRYNYTTASSFRAQRFNLDVTGGAPVAHNVPWARASSNFQGVTSGTGAYCWDTAQERAIGLATTGNIIPTSDLTSLWTLGSFLDGVGTFSSVNLQAVSAAVAPTNIVMCWWPFRKMAVSVGIRNGAHFSFDLWDLDSSTTAGWSRPPLQFIGAAPTGSNRVESPEYNPGLPSYTTQYSICHCPDLDEFYVRSNAIEDIQKIWKLVPPLTNPKTGTWTMTEIVMPGDAVEDKSAAAGINKQLQWADKLKCVIWVARVGGGGVPGRDGTAAQQLGFGHLYAYRPIGV